MHDIATWEAFFRESLGLPFVFALVTELDPGFSWSRAETQLADSFESPVRRETWLRGRSALKLVLVRLGEDTDSSDILFPAPRYSLTHCGQTAVAVGLEAGSHVDGIGVDLELGRIPPERSGRFFLTDEESEWMMRVDASERDATLLRLWTVKEALFKADPDNAGRLLTHYRLENPSSQVGRAFALENVLEYASLAIPNGMLSVAISTLR